MYGQSKPQQQYRASGYGGHYQPPQFGAPPGTDPQLWQYFTNVDTDRSGSIDVNELQSALVNGRAFKII
jgi:peflin